MDGEVRPPGTAATTGSDPVESAVKSDRVSSEQTADKLISSTSSATATDGDWTSFSQPKLQGKKTLGQKQAAYESMKGIGSEEQKRRRTEAMKLRNKSHADNLRHDQITEETEKEKYEYLTNAHEEKPGLLFEGYEELELTASLAVIIVISSILYPSANFMVLDLQLYNIMGGALQGHGNRIVIEWRCILHGLRARRRLLIWAEVEIIARLILSANGSGNCWVAGN